MISSNAILYWIHDDPKLQKTVVSLLDKVQLLDTGRDVYFEN